MSEQLESNEPSEPTESAARKKKSGKLYSMTGFARAAGSFGLVSWAVEVKAVNGKGLELRSRLPSGWEALELPLRTRVQSRLTRGNLQLSINIESRATSSSWRVDRKLVEDIMEVANWFKVKTGTTPSLESILSIRGVIEQVDNADATLTDQIQAAVLGTAEQAINGLLTMRKQEGRALLAVLSAQLGEARRLVAEARVHAGGQTLHLRDRLAQSLAELMQAGAPVSEDRLAAELALLGTRADVREELDRLDAHIGAFTDMLAAGGAVGRRLDFLCQELGREANTLCAKSASLALTDCGLGLKALIEQVREQVQNLE